MQSSTSFPPEQAQSGSQLQGGPNPSPTGIPQVPPGGGALPTAMPPIMYVYYMYM